MTHTHEKQNKVIGIEEKLKKDSVAINYTNEHGFIVALVQEKVDEGRRYGIIKLFNNLDETMEYAVAVNDGLRLMKMEVFEATKYEDIIFLSGFLDHVKSTKKLKQRFLKRYIKDYVPIIQLY